MSTATEILIDETESKETERLQVLASIYQTANRVISGSAVRVAVEKSYFTAPAWTTGDVITFNSEHINGIDMEDIERMNGINFHELSHVLFTPRQTSSLMIWVLNGNPHRNVRFAFNVLEDQRIETMFSSLYPSTVPWFSAAVARWVLAEKKAADTGYLFVRGRKYLDGRLRGALRASFICPELLPRVDAVIDEYRTLTFPESADRAKELIAEFCQILQEMEDLADTSTHNMVPDDIYGHGSRDAESLSKGRTKNNREQAKAQSRVTDSDDEVDPANAGADESKDSGDSENSGDDASEARGDQPSNESGEGDSGSDGDEGTDSTGSTTQHSQAASAGGDDGDIKELVNQVAKDVLNTIRNDQSVVQDIKRVQRQISSSMGGESLPKSKSQLIDPDYRFAQSLGAVRKRLQRLLSKADPGWESRESSGRVNPMRWSQERDITTAFDSWNEGINDANDMEVVIMLDESGSMGQMISQAVNAMWVMKRALDRINVPATVITYSNESKILYSRTEKAGAKIKYAFAAGGTDPLDGFIQASQLFSRTTKKRKILINLTDGVWHGSTKDRMTSDDYMKKFNREGVTTAVGFLVPDHYVVDQFDMDKHHKTYGHHASIFRILSPESIVAFIDNIVSQNIKGAIRR